MEKGTQGESQHPMCGGSKPGHPVKRQELCGQKRGLEDPYKDNLGVGGVMGLSIYLVSRF